MARKTGRGNDWQQRVEDRQKSLSSKHDRIKRKGVRRKITKKENDSGEKSFFNKFEEKVDEKYRDILHEEIFLVECNEGKIEPEKPTPIYEDLATLLLQARENIGLYLVLSWPEAIEWPQFAQILANKTITADCGYENGLKVSFYPASVRSMNRGKFIRIDKNELIREARQAAQNNCLCTRHGTYFALNDFDKDEEHNIRQNPCIIESTPYFELDENSEWSVIGGGYFKDIYTCMFNITGNKRRSVIEKLASQLNNPEATREGGFLIPASISPKDAARYAHDPVQTDVLLVDGRSKILNGMRGGSDLVKTVMAKWAGTNQDNSLLVVMDDPKIYKKTVYQAVDLIKDKKVNFDRAMLKRFSFFQLDSEITVSPERANKSSIREFDNVPQLFIAGLKSYNKIAKLYKIAKRIESYDKRLCHQMYRAIGFVDRLVTLPVSQDDLRSWIRDLTENWSEFDTNTLAKKYLWKSYRREWVLENSSSGAVASKNEFLSVCDEIEQEVGETNEVTDLLINQLLDGLNRNNHSVLVLVKERRVCEFVRDMLSDLLAGDDEMDVNVDIYSSDIDSSSYHDVYILGLKERDLKDILFTIPEGKVSTNIYISTASAFKIENELNVVLDLSSFESVHGYISKVKGQITPTLDSIRHMGVPTQYGEYKGHGNSYDYDYAYTSFANVYLSNKQVFDVGKDTTILKFSQGAFYAVNAEHLDEGDWILPLDGFIEEVEADLGRALPREGKDSALLKSYFQMAQKNLSSQFICNTRVERARKVFESMKSINSDVCEEIHEGMVNRWIKHIEEYSSEDELTSNSAKKKEHFMLFAKALGISDSLSDMFWEEGVKATRVDHIQAGRGISNTLKHILLKTTSGNELDLSDTEVGNVVSMAKQRLIRVELILPTDSSEVSQ